MKGRARRILGGVTMLALLSAVWGPDHARAKVDHQQIVVVGPVEFSSSGEITVNGYGIAPAGAFRPSSLDEGDVVVIIGVLLPDGDTLRAESLELFESP